MNKILVIQQKMIGDVLVSSIICNNLKKAYPNSEIHYMVYESTTPVLEGNTNIDKLILFTDKYRKSKWAFFKFMMQIRKEKYDIVIDAYSKLESWLTVFFSGANQRISYHKKGRAFLYTDKIRMLESPKSNLGLTIERRLSLLDPFNLNFDLDPIPKLFVTKDEKQDAKNLMQSHGVDSDKKTIMVSILGSADVKTYPLKYMSKLIDFIADDTNVNILFNYLPSQLELATKVYNACKVSTKEHVYFDLIGKNLRGYIALMNECELIIGNDGGAINMAKALNKPSFIIFSPWIEKRMWATFEDGNFHKSVHLQELKPELFVGKSEKELKKSSIKLYEYLKPDFILPELKAFLKFNLQEENKLELHSIIKTKESVKREKLSALIIIYNEAENLRELIKSVSFADEIIIVDSYSTDNSEEIIKEFIEVKFIQKEFLNYSNQRNFAIDQATNNWILFIDADERISNNLKFEIINKLKNPKDIVAFGMYRQFYAKNDLLKFSGFQTDKVYRLFNKNFASYNEEKLVHETLTIKGKTETLNNRLDHYSFKSHEDYKSKMKRYAKLRAKELYTKKLKPNFFHFTIKPLYRFFYHFIIRFGFLDGSKGYIISALNAYGVKQRYVELQKLYTAKV